MVSDLKLIVLDNFEEFGNKVDKKIMEERKTDKSFIVKIKRSRFGNGEGKVVIQETVRDKDIYILTDVGNNSLTYRMGNYINHMSPDDHIQDVKRVISAISSHASRITLVMPLLYQSRQHRRNGRESLDCAVMLQDMINIGVDEIITFDTHDPDIQNAIPNHPFTNFFLTSEMINEFLKTEKVKLEDLIIVSPDTGAMDRARYFADTFQLNNGIGLFYKRRDFSKVVDGKNPIIDHIYIGPDPIGKTAIIVDDMIASGESMIDVANQLKEKEIKKTYFFATYALFTNGIDNFKKAYEDGKFSRLYTTNLSHIDENYLHEPWIERVDCSNYVSRIISALNQKRSLEPILTEKPKIKELKKITK
jgi:ribose-phosphate pyrophosphokinase